MSTSQSKIYWQRNLAVFVVGAFLSEAAISLIVPMLPLFLKSLGHFSSGQLNVLAGVAFAITFLFKALASPLWGKLSDQKGHKVMLLRASGGLALCCFLVALSPNVLFLIVVRAVQGLFAGYINNAEAMLAIDVPKNKNGLVLGILATGDTAGLLCGPIIGGVLVTLAGFRITFIISSLLMVMVFLLSLFLVRETFVQKKSSPSMGILATLKAQRLPQLIVLIFTMTLLIQATNTAVNPILSLYLEKLAPHTHQIALISGVIAALPGISTVLSATFFGRLSDRIGQTKLLACALVFGCLVYLPQIFTTSLGLFAGCRFLTGFSIAALMPTLQTLLTKQAEPAAMGRIFSYNQTFQALGNVSGALFSSVVATQFGYHNVFTFIFLIEVCGLLLVGLSQTTFFHTPQQSKSLHS